MSEFSWYILIIVAVVILVSGGIGAFLHAAIQKYRNRVQPIGRRSDVFPRFEDPVNTSCSRNNLTFSDGQKSYKYDELHIVQVQLSNQGDLDLEEFKFGITLSEGDTAVFVEFQSPDRHHQVEQITSLSCADPNSKIDFILRPFNKTDTYSLRLLLITEEPTKEPGDIEFSSPQSVRFVNLPTTTEILEKAAQSASIGFGPFSISLGG